jgi:predicted  nucleic acid-binding Zn-ribbon protein
MKIGIGDLIGIIGLGLGLLSGVWAIVRWYGALRESIYGAKRDLEHLRRNFQQAQGEITRLDALLDSLQNELIEHKTILSLLLAERGQTQSGILGYREKRKSHH